MGSLNVCCEGTFPQHMALENKDGCVQSRIWCYKCGFTMISKRSDEGDGSCIQQVTDKWNKQLQPQTEQQEDGK